MADFSADIDQCLKVLHDGGVILYPTDTVWGLGCDATNEAAVDRIIALKQKKSLNGLVVLLATERDVLKYVTQPDLAVFDYIKEFSKPVTVIYEGGIGVAEKVFADDGTIAIRLVNDVFCRHLVKRFRKPLVSTSANIHGQPTPKNFFEVNRTFLTKVDYTVKYRQNENEQATASAIVKWKPDGTVHIIRN